MRQKFSACDETAALLEVLGVPFNRSQFDGGWTLALGDPEGRWSVFFDRWGTRVAHWSGIDLQLGPEVG
jgi:hypothetical protein